MRPLLPLLGVILVGADGMMGDTQMPVLPVAVTPSRNDFPCTKLAEILPDAALNHLKAIWPQKVVETRLV